MAASTISRSLLTDNVTIWNAAQVNSAIYDKIDNMLSGGGAYATLTLGGLLAAEGFGTHSLSAGGTGGNILAVRNTTAGTGNYSEVRVGNDNAFALGRLIALSSTFDSTLNYQASGVTLEAGGSGGLNLAATSTNGHRFYIDGTAYAVIKSGVMAIGTGTLNAPSAMNLSGDTSQATEATQYGRCLQTTRAASNTGQHIAMVRSGNSIWSLGYVYGTNTFAIGLGQATDSNFTAANAALQITSGSLVYIRDGTSAAPALAFADDTDSGLYRSSANTVQISVGATDGLSVSRTGTPLTLVSVPSAGNGTGAIAGQQLLIGRNSSGNGAAGSLQMVTLDGDAGYLWVDATGDLRIHTEPPLENGSVSDTAGTVVGDQTSTRDSKEDVAPYDDHAGALALLERTPLRTFRYRGGKRNGTTFLGIIADEAPDFVMDPADVGGIGRVFNPINAFGYTAAAIKALAARVTALERAR